MSNTILGIGAHYDDCVFGIPGILLQAVRKNHRVVILSLIGDYANWKPVRGWAGQLIEGTIEIGREYGVEHQFLDFASMQFDVDHAAKRAVSSAIARIRPDIAFMLWPHDRHTDHEVASRLSKIAVRHGDRMLDREQPFRRANRIYEFDNGPRHTVGFEPNTFVDITDDWPRAIEWLGRLMAMVRNQQYDPTALDNAQRAKESLARYRGHTCGVRYAEALHSSNAYPVDIL